MSMTIAAEVSPSAGAMAEMMTNAHVRLSVAKMETTARASRDFRYLAESISSREFTFLRAAWMAAATKMKMMIFAVVTMTVGRKNV